MQHLAFYIFAGIAIFSSVSVVLSKNTVKSVLFLILSFISTGCLWLLLEAEFLAIILILVYVGAVIVLFLFVVMMIDQEIEIKNISVSKYSPFIIFTSLVMLFVLLTSIEPYSLSISMPEIKGSNNNVVMLGTLLYNNHIFAFEIAGILLLVGMIAAIAISFRGKQDRLSQDISEQVNIKADKRLKYVELNNDNIKRDDL